MKRTLIACSLALVLTACGSDESANLNSTDTGPSTNVPDVNTGGGVTETREEMITRVLNLPPEPDETENNATVEGVDGNNNGIRDDIERDNAFMLYPQDDTDAEKLKIARQKIAIVNELDRVARDTMLNIDNIEKLKELTVRMFMMGDCESILLSEQEEYDFRQLSSKRYGNTSLRKDFYKRLNAIEARHDVGYPAGYNSKESCNQFLSTVE